MATSVAVDVHEGDEEFFTVDFESATSNTQLQQPNACCTGQQDCKMPSIFDIVKAGALVPLQTFVEIHGVNILSNRDADGNTPAHWACLKGHKVMMLYIVELNGPVNEPGQNEVGQRPIHWACVTGQVSIVNLLLQLNISIDVADNKGFTPLIVAAQYGQTVLAGFLIGRGASLYVVDKEGDTALHWAASKGHNELMRMLIYLGFNPNQSDSWGQVPLHMACINGNLTSVKELCEQDKVDMKIVDKKGKTPLMLATGRKHETVVTYLKKEFKQRSSLFPKVDLGSVVFGPPGNSKGPLLIVILTLLCWGYPVYILKCIPMTWLDLQLTHMIFIGTNIIMWIALYYSNVVDPGFLAQNTSEYDETLRQIGNYDTINQGISPFSNLCHTCRTVKIVRSKHCRTCNRCVKSFDHHCPYVYNCVGINNRVWFITFVTAVFIMCISGNYLAIYMMYYGDWSWLLFLGILEICLFTCITFFILSTSFYQICFNLTTNERVNWKRYKYLQDGKGKYYNPYDRGIIQNILEFLHIKSSLSENQVEFMNVTVV